MANVLAFRSTTPTIYVDGSDDCWWLNVRPCPPCIATLTRFRSRKAALSRAIDLQNEFGWTIDLPDRPKGVA